MCNWQDYLAKRLVGLYQLLAKKLRESDYLKVDETPIPCLEPGKGKTALGYFWVYHHSEHGPLYDWHKSRANDCLDQILIDPETGNSFKGYLQSDGLRAYRTFIERIDAENIIPVSCLAHIRRKFRDARDDHPRIAAWILYQMRQIYQIEGKLKEQGATSAQRLQVRLDKIRRHYDHLKKLFLHLSKTRRIVPKSLLGKALSYALDQWDHLEPCFLDGQIELDNNLTEGAIRPTKLGAKNWLFIGSEDTGWRSAVIYTFVEQVRRHGRDPFAYFKWVFEKLMHDPADDELEALLPATWVAAQSEGRESQESAA